MAKLEAVLTIQFLFSGILQAWFRLRGRILEFRRQSGIPELNLKRSSVLRQYTLINYNIFTDLRPPPIIRNLENFKIFTVLRPPSIIEYLQNYNHELRFQQASLADTQGGN